MKCLLSFERFLLSISKSTKIQYFVDSHSISDAFIARVFHLMQINLYCIILLVTDPDDGVNTEMSAVCDFFKELIMLPSS